jgi:fumarate reductase subunit D
MTEHQPHVARLHAIFWGIFSIGGFIAAFLLPIFVYLVGIAYPLHLWPVANSDPTQLFVLSRGIIGKLGILFVFVVIGGSLFHGLFRFQSTLVEMGARPISRGLAGLFYAIIAIGLIVLVYYLLVLHPTFFNI